MNILKKFQQGLTKTRQGLEQRLGQIFSGSKPAGPELLESVEEILIGADLGTVTTRQILAKLKSDLSQGLGRKSSMDLPRLKAYLKHEFLALFRSSPDLTPPDAHALPHTILMVGVNGVGKTTTIGKLSAKFRGSGKKVLLAAGDTFRAAAIEQLSMWAGKTQCDVIMQQQGSDPSAVAFDALAAAKARGAEILIVDTAGRLHTKSNLMEELKKIKRVMAKALPGSPHEILLVLDATTGQNALSQARMFHEALGVTGIVMTKLDGTAKGGILVAIVAELKIPVKQVGVGEGPDDLLEFNPEAFVEGLLD
jgi:fused signal recognition particle receptor